MLKKMYDKCVEWAGHRFANPILAFIAFLESFIFPIPTDAMLIPMIIAKRHEFLKISLIAIIFSVLGALIGYLIGYVFFNEIGIKIFEFYGVDPSFWKSKVSSEGGAIAWMTLLAIAGFSPVPFKLLTISSGFVNFNLVYFVIVALITRGSRFFLITFLIGNFGPTMKLIIEKKLLKISIIASIILIIFAYLVYKFLNNFLM